MQLGRVRLSEVFMCEIIELPVWSKLHSLNEGVLYYSFNPEQVEKETFTILWVSVGKDVPKGFQFLSPSDDGCYFWKIT